MNPLMNNGLKFGNNIQQVKSLMKQMKMFSNPNDMVKNNPQIAQVMNMLQGKNPREVFYSMAKSKGIDPEQFLQELQS